jgi:hypothetical protein
MAAPEQQESLSPQLSSRIESYRQEIQNLVKQGGEQPQFEFKRAVALGREDLDDRLDFVKLVQALANAEMPSERCIVIGADPKEKKFHPVSNVGDFDPANLSKILSKYLHPSPNFQSFRLDTDAGETFIALVLDRDQPRPIMVIKEGQTTLGKTRLVLGDIWIKKNTDTLRVTREQLDAMYRVRMEEEAEDRARKRLKHLLEEKLIPIHPLHTGGAQTILPTVDLLIGPQRDLINFCEQLIANNDLPRLQMLLELGRETLVEGWDSVDESDKVFFDPNPAEFADRVGDFYKNRFSPILDSVIECGVIGIKHTVQTDWLNKVVDLIVEAFTECSNLRNRLGGMHSVGNVAFYVWRPAFDCYLGIRTLAAYAILRNKLPYLETILPRIVKAASLDLYSRTAKSPLILWPFVGQLPIGKEFGDGRAQFFWKDRISSSWGKHFRSASRFLDATCQLEFLLEFNSFLGINSQQDKKFGEWLAQYLEPDISFRYTPDLFSQDLQSTVPMADRLYDVLSAGGDFPPYLALDPNIQKQALAGLDKTKRLELYGDFLYSVKSWQSSFMWHQLHRIEFMWNWEGRLKQLSDPAAQRAKLKKA